MRRLLAMLPACLWACGDNALRAPDAMMETGFHPAPHVRLPLVAPHAANRPRQEERNVLTRLELVTLTFDDYPARRDVEAFGDALVASRWYQSVGFEYDIYPPPAGKVTQKHSLGATPKALSRAQLAARIMALVANPPPQLPLPTAVNNQVLYLIYVPPKVMPAEVQAGVAGYHQMLTVDQVRFPIAVVIDDGAGLAATTTTAARQVINAVTNPYEPRNDGYYLDPPITDPWSLARGELADLCESEDPVREQGIAYPRVYSNLAAAADRSPCKPYEDGDDTWTAVTAVPSRLEAYPADSAIPFELTGWSTREVPDWKLTLRAADRSDFTLEELRPELSAGTVNNGTSVTLTLHAPAHALPGQRGGVYVLSGPNQHPWAVGFTVE